jgi:hypothetical protein
MSNDPPADNTPEAPADDAPHSHGPRPSFEWVLEGDREMVLPHLKTIAPAMTWETKHFHVRDIEPHDEDWPELFQIELGDEPVGAVDFMPLPAKRTLMRLYVCSDLGTSCSLENGNTVIQGFATAWLGRLQKLGFLSSAKTEVRDSRPLGFATPSSSDAD